MATPSTRTISPTSATNIKQHVTELKQENRELEGSILPLRSATVSLKRKLQELDSVIPDAESKRAKWFSEGTRVKEELEEVENQQYKLDIRKADLDEKKRKLEDYEKAIAKETASWNTVRAQTLAKIESITQEEKKKRDKIKRNGELMETLQALSKPPVLVAAPGEYLCENCGMAVQTIRSKSHLSRCWGRCKRCYQKGLPCDSGRGANFSSCSKCQKSRSKVNCERLAGTRAIAQRTSSLVGVSKRNPATINEKPYKLPNKKAAKGIEQKSKDKVSHMGGNITDDSEYGVEAVQN